MEDIVVKVDGKEYNVKVEEKDNGKLIVRFDNEVFEVETKDKIEEKLEEISSKKEDKADNTVKAPMPGTVLGIEVKKGQEIKKGTVLIKLIAMKMENEIVSTRDAVVKEIKVKKNDNVKKGDILIIVG